MSNFVNLFKFVSQSSSNFFYLFFLLPVYVEYKRVEVRRGGYIFGCDVFEPKRNSIKCKNKNKPTADVEYNTLVGQTVRHCFLTLFVCAKNLVPARF